MNIFSCLGKEQAKKKRYARINETFYYDGTLQKRFTSIGLKLEGLCQEWHKNGQLSYQYYFKNDKKHGPYYGWWKNGQIGFIKNYKDGVLDGRQFHYDEKGALILTEIYVDGNKAYTENNQNKFYYYD